MDEKNGRCAILLPHGVLFRKEEKEIREKLINMDILDTVIGIGKNLFFNSGMDACIMLFRKNKPAERKGKVLFIDAHQEVTRKNAESYMEPHHIAKIVEAYRKYENVDGFSKIEENRNIISNNKSKLSIKRYVRPQQSLNQASCTTHLTAWQENMMTLHTLLDDLNKNL
jgi:type I restriction enzyme M protein